jgi:hypothetical protein
MGNRPHSNGDEQDDECRPLEGVGERGREFSAADVPEDRDADRRTPRPAPAPGTPTSNEEYDRLKEAARRKTPRRDGPAQEDPAGEK